MVKVTSKGPENQAALSPADVARDAAALFTDWRWPKRLLWYMRRTDPPHFDAASGVDRTVDQIAAGAARFLLGHELGHVALDRGLASVAGMTGERAADAVGLEFLRRAGARQGVDPTLTFAHVIVAVRICASLQRVGVDFQTDYGDQNQRVDSLRDVMRAACPSEQFFHEIARIAVAYQDQMDDIDALIERRSIAPPRDPERVLVRLIAMLLDVAIHRLSPARFVANIAEVAARAPPPVMEEALRSLFRYYLGAPSEKSFIDPCTQDSMGTALREAVATPAWPGVRP
jgi:hypothetical protein